MPTGPLSSSKAHGKLGRARMVEVGLVFVKLG